MRRAGGQFVGLFTGNVGIEWAFQRDVLLFAEAHIGGGFADAFSFSGRYSTKFYGGIAYLF